MQRNDEPPQTTTSWLFKTMQGAFSLGKNMLPYIHQEKNVDITVKQTKDTPTINIINSEKNTILPDYVTSKKKVIVENIDDFFLIGNEDYAVDDQEDEKNPQTTPAASAAKPAFFAPIDFAASAIAIDAAVAPVEQRPLSNYKIITGNISKSAHDVYKMIDINSQETFINAKGEVVPMEYYFKQNKHDYDQTYMYELEAAINAFYHFLAPHHTPTSNVIYDKPGHCIGIASKTLVGFVPAIEKPLTKEDTEIAILKDATREETNLIIQELEELDEGYKKTVPDKQVIFETDIKTSAGVKHITITMKDLNKYRTVKGLGIGLAVSYAHAEDDCHRGNIGPNGKRVDFDKDLLELIDEFQETGAGDKILRPPKGRFGIAAIDIIKFPNVVVFNPFYWPTKTTVIPDSLLPLVSLLTQSNVANNSFLSSEVLVYQELETNPVFRYHLFATLLKFILTNEEVYRQLASMHIREEINLIDSFANIMKERLEAFRRELSKVPDFQLFLETSGERVLKNILFDFAEQNEELAKNAAVNPRYPTELINPKMAIQEYLNMCDKMGIKTNMAAIASDPDIAELLAKNPPLIQAPQYVVK